MESEHPHAMNSEAPPVEGVQPYRSLFGPFEDEDSKHDTEGKKNSALDQAGKQVAQDEQGPVCIYRTSTREQLNAQWRLIQAWDFPRRRRWEEVEGSTEDTYEVKRRKHIEKCYTDPPIMPRDHPLKIKRPPPPPPPLVVDEPVTPLHCVWPRDLLAEDATFQGLGMLVNQTPLHFEVVCAESGLQPADLEACFKLVEKTSSADYKASQAGWRPKEKKKEMADKHMIYVLVKTKAKEPAVVGFISYMVTHDEPPRDWRQVLYMYEIHLDESVRGFGLGSKLITFVELVGRKMGILKTMLTVFKTNKRARALYERLGYVKDRASPADKVVRRRTIEADYLIMSRTV
ncbi:hypothetical protein ACEQ8H_000259 [Pleosporales sp. CAS-2024a]